MTTAQLDKMRLELRRGVLVLAVLASLKQPHYGYSLRKQLQDGGIDIDEGTLYPLVRRFIRAATLTKALSALSLTVPHFVYCVGIPKTAYSV